MQFWVWTSEPGRGWKQNDSVSYKAGQNMNRLRSLPCYPAWSAAPRPHRRARMVSLPRIGGPDGEHIEFKIVEEEEREREWALPDTGGDVGMSWEGGFPKARQSPCRLAICHWTLGVACFR
ncbi:hypothetical protein M758_4G212600 [Ceratodon purpureus]|nr:hypothetical protein M758_4G212600 [Ceratodon purpureus]